MAIMDATPHLPFLGTPEIDEQDPYVRCVCFLVVDHMTESSNMSMVVFLPEDVGVMHTFIVIFSRNVSVDHWMSTFNNLV